MLNNFITAEAKLLSSPPAIQNASAELLYTIYHIAAADIITICRRARSCRGRSLHLRP